MPLLVTRGAASVWGFGFGSVRAATTTWDPLNKGTGVVLSNGDRTATSTDFDSRNVTSTTSKTNGKWYFEATYNGANLGGAGLTGIGFLPPGFNVNTYVSNNGGPTWTTNGEIRTYNNTTVTTSLDPWNNSVSVHTLGVAVDVPNKLAWAKVIGGATGYWNGSASADPATGSGGVSLGASIGSGPVLIAAGFRQTGDGFSLNTGQVPFSGAVPSGFVAWR